MKTTVTLILLLLSLLMTGCSEPAWPEFNSEEGRFTVLMPGTPTEGIDDESPMVFHRFMVTHEADSYMVSYGDLPRIVEGSDAEQLLIVQGLTAVQSLNGKLVGAKTITLHEFPGREINIEVPDVSHIVWVRLYIVKDRQYNLMFITSSDHTTLPSEAQRFFSSFKVTP
jgi:hypothetical protein